jgi:cyclopropane-fatty-acyl-phospholipid synthase
MSSDAGLVDALRRLLHLYDAPFGLNLWNEHDIVGPRGQNAPRVGIADKGALAALARRPSLDTFVRLHIEGRVDWPEATFFEIEDFPKHVAFGEVVREIGLPALAREAAKLALHGGAAARPKGTGDRAARKRGDAATNRGNIRHHYDVSNAFYRLFLDPEMVYTCAYFTPDPHDDLARAQRDKLDLVCRKLRLAPGERLLDVGCGWGALIRHAARNYGAICVGVTLSQEQARLAQARIAAEGLADRVSVRLVDFRELEDADFDAIASVGMFEHVGIDHHAAYFAAIHARLKPGGRYLHHAISRVAEGDDRTFRRMGPEYRAIVRYIFPGGELDHLGMSIANLERAGFEIHDVEGLRRHYARTTRLWHDRLRARRVEAEAEVGQETTRLWLLYLAAVSIGFQRNWVGVFQTLCTRREESGDSALPMTRDDLYRAGGM